MAANNYFGFTHSGAQYAPTGATPYQTTQPGYAVAPSAAAAAASYPQRAAPAYDTAYPGAAAAATHTQPGPYAAVQAGTTAPTATYDYAGYAVARSAQPAYDTTKTYYQQQAPAAASYTTTDYAGGGGKPQYGGGGGGSYSSQAAAAAARSGGAAGQKAAAAAYSGSAAYAAAAAAVQQQPGQPNGGGGGYASATYTQQQSSQPGKLIASSLHRNLSSVAEYAQPSQQRSVQTFTQKQVKKPFHAQSSNAVVTTVTMPSSVAAVTSYQTVGGGGNQQAAGGAYSGTGVTANSYTPHQQQSTFSCTSAAAAAKPKTGAIVISKPAAATYTNYDAALYSAATMYVAQQATGGGGGGGGKGGNTWQGGGGGGGYKKQMGGNMSKPVRQKLPPKPQQLHYCDVCKISCAGPQTYKEHLEGQKHKKKEASMKAGSTQAAAPRGVNALRCELCDVTCTGSDAYAAHIRGAKHQKVVKLHTKLGKPIPAVDPKAGPAALAAAGAGTGAVKSETIVATKINFVASGNLGTVKTEQSSSSSASPATANFGRSVSSATGSSSQPAAAAQVAAAVSAASKEDSSAASAAAAIKTEDVEMLVTASDNITPVGHEYIEEILNDEGKPISFNCKLCECKFNDPNAKLMHMKGRRHRLQFKKKVNPDLVVDVKTSMRQRRLQEEKQRKQAMRDDYFRRREEERMMEVEERMYWEERRRYEEEMEYYEWYTRRHHGPRGGMGPPPPQPLPPLPPPYGPPSVMAGPPGPGGPKAFFPGGVGPMPPLHGGAPIRRLDTNDDRHVIARHAAIYPKEAELQAVQKIVSHVERALKLVSDHLTDTSKAAATATAGGGGGAAKAAAAAAPAPAAGAAAAAPKAGGGGKQAPPLAAASKKEDGRSGNLFSFHRDKEEANAASRVLKGVMRIGVLAKGLLLAGDTHTQLVMLCADKPTRSLLAKVAANLPAQLKTVAPDDSYSVVGKPDEAAIVISTSSEPKMSVTVTLTSPVVREQLIGSPTTATADGAVTQADVTQAAAAGGVGACVRHPPDLLDKAKCLEGLAALRHAKWFQARVNGLQSCVMVIRILRDLCIRNPTWAPLNSWAMELLAEKVVSSAGRPISPGMAVRRIMEALASGLLLAPHGPGLLDPCEKEPTDAAASLTAQQREDITASAQHALRLMAFRQTHKVLGMEMLQPPAKFRSGGGGGSGGGGQRGFARKRRRDNSTGEGNDSEAGDGKKDKKDDTAAAAAAVKMEK